MKKHSNNYRIYEIQQDLINFLKGEGTYSNRPTNRIDSQIYSHYGQIKTHSDKYIGIIIELENRLYFAPITHDGDKKWLNKRDDTYDFEIVYDKFNKYTGSLLLCKALPLTENLVDFKSLEKIRNTEGEQYANLCNDELHYLNSKDIHDKIQDKMQACIYGKESNCMSLRVNYHLAIENVAEYNALIIEKQNKEIKELEKIIKNNEK